jgi:hypothetical protein
MKRKLPPKTFILNNDGIDELEKYFKNRSDQEKIIKSLQSFKAKAKILQSLQPEPFLATRVLARWKEQTSTNFWTSFEFVPRFFIQVVYAISILIMIILFVSYHQPQVISQNGLVQIDEATILQNQWSAQSINTPEQALQLALNIDIEN